jgi:hypothetical protein
LEIQGASFFPLPTTTGLPNMDDFASELALIALIQKTSAK